VSLQLVHPQAARVGARRQAVLLAQVEQDVGHLADDQLAGLQEGRREGRIFLDVERRHQQVDPAFAARHVDVVGARFFQRQADEFAAALDARPIE